MRDTLQGFHQGSRGGSGFLIRLCRRFCCQSTLLDMLSSEFGASRAQLQDSNLAQNAK